MVSVSIPLPLYLDRDRPRLDGDRDHGPRPRFLPFAIGAHGDADAARAELDHGGRVAGLQDATTSALADAVEPAPFVERQAAVVEQRREAAARARPIPTDGPRTFCLGSSCLAIVRAARCERDVRFRRRDMVPPRG